MTAASDWLDQARRLLDVLVQEQDTAAGDDTGGTTATHGADCTRCPLCQAAAVVRGERPEVTAALADVLTATATALRTFAESGRPAEPGGEVGAQGGAAPGQVRAEQDGVPGPVEPAGRADPHAHQVAVVPGRQLLDHGGDGVLGVGDRGAGSRAAGCGQHGALRGHQPAGDLRAPDVDADRG